MVNVEQVQHLRPLFKGGYLMVLKSGATVRSGRQYRANVQGLMRKP